MDEAIVMPITLILILAFIIGIMLEHIKESRDDYMARLIDRLKDLDFGLSELSKCAEDIGSDSQWLFYDIGEPIAENKKEERCEYCGCLYINDEVICSHCGAPR